MKKKIVALVLLLALVSTFFVGCSLFETDANRDYHQVVANVSYNTQSSGAMTAVVYKGEVKTQVNIYGSYFMQSYGWSADDVVEYCFNNVARQKLLLLYAQEYLYLNKLIPDGFGFGSLGEWNEFKNKDVKNHVEAYAKFLTVDELRYCIETVNKQFDDSWQDLIEEREKELAKNDGSDGETSSGEEEEEIKDSDLLTARDQKDRSTDEDEDDEYELNEAIKTQSDIVKYFADMYEVELDDSNISNAYFFNYVNSLIRKENNDKAKIMRTALSELRKNIEDQYMDYEYFLVQQMQSQITTKYTDHVGTLDKVIAEVNKDFDTRYKDLVASAITTYNDKDNSAYNTAVGNQTFAYAAPSKDYLQVKSILLSFTDAQKNAITKLAELNSANEDITKILRNAYATGVVPKEYEDLTLNVFADLGIKVNVSNPDYDADEDKLVDAYTDASIEGKEDVYANPSVDYLTVLSAMANDIKAKVDRALDWANTNSMSDIEKYLVKQHASKEAFNDWINLVNDDGGMVSSDVYSVTPEGESTSYVEEYTVLARKLASAGVGAMAIKDYDKKDATTGNIDYTGTTEILKGGNGAYTLYKQNMTTSVGEFKDELSADVYTLVTASGAEISFIVNEFGIHIVMLAGLPVDENLGTLSQQVKPDAADETKDKTFYVKNSDYLYEYSVKVEYAKDEEDNDIKTQIEKITVESKTIEEYLKDTINDELSSNITRLQQLKLFGDDNYIAKVDKVYSQIVKELKKAVGE
ncbi:MAG: hypothetical protein K2K85_08775 [Clostridia bacterium]|nr:hypothetical protein [Clostridia bacterium]MDE6606093.1 hypothetical protein [Clostridia bacterium]